MVCTREEDWLTEAHHGEAIQHLVEGGLGLRTHKFNKSKRNRSEKRECAQPQTQQSSQRITLGGCVTRALGSKYLAPAGLLCRARPEARAQRCEATGLGAGGCRLNGAAAECAKS